jgi:hypothetical protein
MLRSVLTRSLGKRVGRRLPLAPVLLAGEIALMAGRHLARLDGAGRRRLATLVRKSASQPGSLSATEHEELSALIATLEPRLFVGSTIRRLSPMPLPKRLLYGRRGSSARNAAAEQS